ncbi:MAG: Crp/Fnr family transcriptional regulator [Magnetococcales bacterium]|nr:Crp/Fnr family transcriptional regulator [Magnetococcales bacterium]
MIASHNTVSVAMPRIHHSSMHRFSDIQPERVAEHSLPHLQTGVRTHPIQAGEILFRSGEVTGPVLLLVRGTVKYSGTGGRMGMPTAEAGQYLNIAAHFLEPSCYFVTAEASEAGQLLSLDATLFRGMLLESPESLQAVMRQMAWELKTSTTTLINENRCGVCRVSGFLLEHAPPRPWSEPYPVQLDKTRRQLAAQLGLREETLSRIIGLMEKNEMVCVRNKSLLIVQHADLLQKRLATCPRCAEK